MLLEQLDLGREELGGVAGAESHQHGVGLAAVEADHLARAAVGHANVVAKGDWGELQWEMRQAV